MIGDLNLHREESYDFEAAHLKPLRDLALIELHTREVRGLRARFRIVQHRTQGIPVGVH